MSKRLTHKEYCLQIKDRRIDPIEEYNGAYQKIKHRCKICNNIWSVTPKSIKNNNGCPACYQKSVRKPLQQVNNELSELGWKLVVPANYINSYKPLMFEHSCGNVVQSNLDRILRKTRRCLQCNPSKKRQFWSKTVTTNNRSYASKIEMECCEYLISIFGVDDIILQKLYPNESRKTADAYIISIDCYVEISTINKQFYFDRIYNKRQLVKNFAFASSIYQLKQILNIT